MINKKIWFGITDLLLRCKTFYIQCACARQAATVPKLRLELEIETRN